MKNVGIEAIAFYAPYHTYGLNYGIYFYEDRLLSFVNHLQSLLPQKTFYEIFRAVFRFILKHELFHFKIELVSTISERILQRQLYRCISRDTEENLAQAYAFRARIQPDIKRILEDFFLSIPMYKNFKMYNDPTMRENALKNILPESHFFISFEDTLINPYTSSDVPKYLIVAPSPVSGSALCFLTANVRMKELLRCLQREFGVPVKVISGGKHEKIYLDECKRPITFPRGIRKGIPPYVLREICNVLKIDKKRLLRECFDVNI